MRDCKRGAACTRQDSICVRGEASGVLRSKLGAACMHQASMCAGGEAPGVLRSKLSSSVALQLMEVRGVDRDTRYSDDAGPSAQAARLLEKGRGVDRGRICSETTAGLCGQGRGGLAALEADCANAGLCE